MRITLVNGFFLPVPPMSGGSTEKSWYHLGREFASRGHEVVSFSRQWRTFADEETDGGVRHRRLQGYDHSRSLWRNLWSDFLWSWRVFRRLPEADIIVCNAVTMPMWLGRLRPRAGRVVVMSGRMPKGQYRRYSRLARVLAPSSFVKDRVIAENPALRQQVRVTGYPINWSLLRETQACPQFLPPRFDKDDVTLGFAGRIHHEKGLLLLAEALNLIAKRTRLPPWRIILCGPSDIERGGSGADYRGKLLSSLSPFSTRVHLLDPQFNERTLAGIYQRMDVFCYPSLAEQGETFGVAVAEAMAAGAVPIVSDLPCFRDFVKHDQNGIVFQHSAKDAASRLAAELEAIICDTARRERLARQAQSDVQGYDFPAFANMLLDDFTQLLTNDAGAA